MLESIFTDIRFALRWLWKSPGFTVVAVASLAIGIGFNTALFTIVDALLFKPLPVAAPEQLVDVFTSGSTGTARYSTSSYPDYLDLKAQNDVFTDLVGYTPMFGALNLDNRSRLVMGEAVTGNYFQAFGVPAAIGRTLAPDDDRPGAAAVAMVSYKYWVREMASTLQLGGQTLRIRGTPYAIVGVARSGFTGMVPVLSPEIWIPMSASLDVEPVGIKDTLPSPTGTTRLDRRADRWMFMRGRLKAGKTIDEARANLNVLMSRLETANPITNKGRVLTLKATNEVHLHPAADPQILPIAAGLIVVVGLVLLIACANVASMLLARASARQKEIGIRLAIGASRGRLVQQLLTEGVVLSVIGAIGGVLLAWWATHLVASLSLPIAIPLTFDLHIDGRVLLFTLVATLVAGVLAGLAPALQALKTNLTADLRGEQVVAPRTAFRRWTLRDLLVAIQMAVTALLLVVAALLTRSLIAAERTKVGFAVDRLAVVSMDPSMLRYSDERSRRFFDEAMDRIRAIPGVDAVAIATRVPFSMNFNRWEIWIPGRHRPGELGDVVEVTTVSPEYFTTLGVAILEGRGFTVDDRPDTPRVAIVNEALAHKFWPGESAIGKIFHTRGGAGPAFQIIGISATHKVLTVGEAPTPFLHIARAQRPSGYGAIIARTRGDAPALLHDMRRELLALEPNIVFVENQTMEAEVGATLFPVRASAWLVGSVGLMAMLLAAIGLYGVIAYSVARRTREIGIRMALGARPSVVLANVMKHGLLVAAAGLAAGFALITVVFAIAVVAAGAIPSEMYGISIADPVSWLGAAAVLLTASAVANLIPAWRAAHVDPTDALRIE